MPSYCYCICLALESYFNPTSLEKHVLRQFPIKISESEISIFCSTFIFCCHPFWNETVKRHKVAHIWIRPSRFRDLWKLIHVARILSCGTSVFNTWHLLTPQFQWLISHIFIWSTPVLILKHSCYLDESSLQLQPMSFAQHPNCGCKKILYFWLLRCGSQLVSGSSPSKAVDWG